MHSIKNISERKVWMHLKVLLKLKNPKNPKNPKKKKKKKTTGLDFFFKPGFFPTLGPAGDAPARLPAGGVHPAWPHRQHQQLDELGQLSDVPARRRSGALQRAGHHGAGAHCDEPGRGAAPQLCPRRPQPQPQPRRQRRLPLLQGRDSVMRSSLGIVF
jgi:hypothetical protein